MGLTSGEQEAFTEAMITLAAQDRRLRALAQFQLTGTQNTLPDDVFVPDQESLGTMLQSCYDLEDYNDVISAIYLARQFVSEEGYTDGHGWHTPDK